MLRFSDIKLHLLFTALLLPGVARSQQIKVATNNQVAETWQQNSPTDKVPVVVEKEDGSTSLEWHGSFTTDAYNNDIKTNSGTTNTPLQSGNFYKAVFQGDLRKTDAKENVDFFQFGVTGSNDRSVLSLSSQQLNNFQIGCSGPDYFFSLGDIAPNFSSLSTALGARGILGQKQFSDYLVSSYGGIVAESWEALTSSVQRTQFLRDVYGAKIEKEVNPYLKMYVTGQAGSDRSGSITNSTYAASANATKLHAYTFGFQYEIEDQLRITGETAVSDSKQDTEADRTGNGSIIDASWQDKKVTVRAGYHDIENQFTSLAAMAIAGTKEALLGVDWTTTPSLVLGAEIRNSKSITLATLTIPSKTTDTDSTTARGNFTFDPEKPDWVLNLQQTNSKARDLTTTNISKNGQSSATVKYASKSWTTGLTGSYSEVRNESLTAMDSNQTNWQLSIGKSYDNEIEATKETEAIPATKIFDANFTYMLQNQKLLTGENTLTTNRSLTLSAQYTEWGSLNLILSDGLTSRPNGLSDLKLLSKEFEAVYNFSEASKAKFFLRDTQTNLSDPLLGVEERVTGAQYTYTF